MRLLQWPFLQFFKCNGMAGFRGTRLLIAPACCQSLPKRHVVWNCLGVVVAGFRNIAWVRCYSAATLLAAFFCVCVGSESFCHDWARPCVKLCTAKLCLENQNKTYRDQSYPKAFPQINKRESNFPCSLAQITPDNKQRFNTHSVSLARAWANEYRWPFSSNTV